MRTVRMISALVALAVFACLPAAVARALPRPVPPGWAVAQLTTSAQDHSDPVMSAGRVAWLSYDGHDDQVVTWKVGSSSPTTITHDARESDQPRVSGDRLAWITAVGSANKMFTWKSGDTTPTRLTNGSVS
jgi:hypothetical protein